MVVNQTIVAYALLILDKKFTLDLVPAQFKDDVGHLVTYFSNAFATSTQSVTENTVTPASTDTAIAKTYSNAVSSMAAAPSKTETTPAVNQGGVVNTQPIVESDDKEATIDLVKGTKEAV